MHLTPDILEAAYDYMRATPPFRRWKLPPGDEVEFHVTRRREHRGDCQSAHNHHIIRISAFNIGHTDSLMRVMAHEMVHIYCDRKKVRSHHGREFLRAAARVCQLHGFDLKLF